MTTTTTTETTIRTLADQINTWNLRDVRDLLDLLRQMRNALTEYNEQTSASVEMDHFGVDMTSLPSADLARFGLADLTEYPIWACDGRGVCLVGATADQVESAADILSANIPGINSAAGWATLISHSPDLATLAERLNALHDSDFFIEAGGDYDVLGRNFITSLPLYSEEREIPEMRHAGGAGYNDRTPWSWDAAGYLTLNDNGNWTIIPRDTQEG